jgi:actin-related protein 8
MLIEDLALRLCHLALDNYAIATHEFFIRRQAGLYKYGLKVADQGIAALMGLFHPAIFALAAEDTVARSTPDFAVLSEDSILGSDPVPEFHMIPKALVDTKGSGGGGKEGGATAPDDADAQFVAVPTAIGKVETFAALLGIDVAITQCIGRCPTETVIKNMYQSILLVGGCAGYPGFGRLLEQRLWAELPSAHRRYVEKERLHVTTRAKNADPRHVAWRGASVVARLSAAQDAWILQSEWEDFGIRVVREKVPFIW